MYLSLRGYNIYLCLYGAQHAYNVYKSLTLMHERQNMFIKFKKELFGLKKRKVVFCFL